MSLRRNPTAHAFDSYVWELKPVGTERWEFRTTLVDVGRDADNLVLRD